MMITKSKLAFWLLLLSISILFPATESKCSARCGFALASYYMWEGSNLTFVNEMLQSSVMPRDTINFDSILSYSNKTNKDFVRAGDRVLVPIPCDCLPGSEFPGHVFDFNVRRGDDYKVVAGTYYSNLTTVESLRSTNSYPETNIPDTGSLKVTVNCTCGDASISKEYGLFVTYPLRPEDSLNSIANSTGLPRDLIQRYNQGVDFSAGSGIVFFPGKDPNGTYRRFVSSKGGIGAGAIAGICVGVAVAALLAVFFIYRVYSRKKSKEALLSSSHDVSVNGNAPSSGNQNVVESGGSAGGPSLAVASMTVDKSVEFSYEELAKATDNFNMAYKIGEGGFGAVYYAELRGEKAAIKKMEMQASKQFLAELKILTRVHHVNLVRLIGYCVEGSLFLVYEFIENGNLGQHLRGSGRDPLQWSTRVQIALDSARGLEYIHEHTVPVYVHRDVKSANILIDQNYHAKVADFGLTKLAEVGGATASAHGVGTFGYMPPETVYGDISAKADVYAFGVVLYELISAKDAILKLADPGAQFRGLVSVFDEVFNQPDIKEALRKIVDPRLGNNYPFDSVFKIAELARACTQESPQIRPTMRYVVVALMTLSSSTGNWDIRNLENDDLDSLMSGR